MFWQVYCNDGTISITKGYSYRVRWGIEFKVPEITQITPSISKAYSGGCQVFIWTLEGGWVSRSPVFYFSDANVVPQTYGTLRTYALSDAPTASPAAPSDASGLTSAAPASSPRIYTNSTSTVLDSAPTVLGSSAKQSDNAVQYCESLRLKWENTATSVVGTATRVYWQGTKTFITVTYTYSMGDGYGGENGDNRVGTYTASPPCCSSCFLTANTMQLIYWAPSTANSAVTTFVNGNGFTFTSPSLYLGFTALSARDACGPIGSAIVNTTLGFNPDQISTIAYGTSGTPTATLPLTVSDLYRNCSGKFWAYLPYNEAGPEGVADPCYPYIAFPTGVEALQPAWGGCTEAVYNGFYDPPYVLSKVSAMDPPSSPAQVQAKTTPQVDPGVASRTYMLTPVSDMNPPSSLAKEQQSTAPRAQPASTVKPAIVSSTAEKVTPIQTVVPVPLPLIPVSLPSVPADPTIKAPRPPSPVQDPGNLPQSPSADGYTPLRSFNSIASNLAATENNDPQAPSGGGDPAGRTTPTPQQPVMTFAGQVITANPTGFTVGTAAVIPNGPAVTVSGVVLSMGSSGVLQLGSSTILIPSPQATANSVVVTANGVAYTATPTGPNFIIAGQTLSVGGPAATISGTPVSLAPGGLVVGTATVPISRAPQVITLNGQIITANSASDYFYGGQTLVPGGAAITVSGTPISLGAAGTDVVVGTSTEGVGLGGLIISGFGGTGGQAPVTTKVVSPSSNITLFIGEGASVEVGRSWGFWMGLGLGIGLLVALL
ncbi:hypothetical protein MMC30_002901 [Trapelia coarctata]|nr:hypothetical protein [Trapelia coarctata]